MKMSALIIGGSSRIAQAIITKLLKKFAAENIVVISRGAQPETFATVNWHQSENDEESMHALAAQFYAEKRNFDKVFICQGILHDTSVKPEKRLEDLTFDALNHVININAITPIVWLKYLLPVLKQSERCQLVVFSARVGSISDNKLGGWYSYRASKAALNMLLKSAAIEYARRAKQVKLVVFHPGTTDTPLSRPYSVNVPEAKLFSPDFVAERLFTLLQTLPADGELSFVDWQGKSIEW